jgi:hypothetical protein
MKEKIIDPGLRKIVTSINLRTSLEEALDWDLELAEHLFKAWNSQNEQLIQLEKAMMFFEMSRSLPDDKKYLGKRLINWLKRNYHD